MEEYKEILKTVEDKALTIYKNFLDDLEGTAERFLGNLKEERQKAYSLIKDEEAKKEIDKIFDYYKKEIEQRKTEWEKL